MTTAGDDRGTAGTAAPGAEVARRVAAANRARALDPAAVGAAAGDGRRAEEWLDARFRTSHRLAVYGTLAPGRPNHHVLAPLGGAWADGVVEGELRRVGWGDALGYPALVPRAGGPAVEVQVLTSPALATAWHDLDAFEGPDYRRILVPVLAAGPDRGLIAVANLYAAAT